MKLLLLQIKYNLTVKYYDEKKKLLADIFDFLHFTYTVDTMDVKLRLSCIIN